jgi:hypothetical protein
VPNAPSVPSATDASPTFESGTPPRQPELAAEVALLERARRALVEKRAEEVLRVLGIYDASPKTGVLDSEAEMLRIEALLRLGHRVAAEHSPAVRSPPILRDPTPPDSGKSSTRRFRDRSAPART